jgi:hypothetical protein
MKDIKRAFRALFLGALLLVTCGAVQAQVPPYNVIDASVNANKSPLTAEDVSKAIRRAGGGLGWKVDLAGPGAMTGTLVLRTHTAVVDILYDTKTYSIKYKDSVNLKYNGTTIHKNYNGWVQNLDKAIQREMQLL